MDEMSKPKPRGRPRSFDEQQVLAAILNVFWVKGFNATSLDDIAEVTGLTRPSLYAAFGNKEAMYLRALEIFRARMEQDLAPALIRGTDPKSALSAFYKAALDNYFVAGGPPLGCMVYTTAVTESVTHPEIRSSLSSFLSQLDAGLIRFFSARDSSMSKDRAEALAKLASSVLISIGIRARSGASRAELDELAESSAAVIAAAAAG